MKNVAIVGFGSRGRMFAAYIAKDKNSKLTAIAEPVEAGRLCAEKEYGIPKDKCYSSAEEFFEQGKIADAVLICSQDKQHKEMALKALNLGYDILLEKPAAATIEDCIEIRDTANRLNKKVMLTHVLRYSPFYRYIKQLIVDGKLGKIANIEQTENVAYWHFALSYVRGPWRSMQDSTPTIIAKCCHDLDLLLWLMDKKCTAISSFGKLFHFKPENAPEGSAKYCCDCPESVRKKCLYNAYSIYPQRIETEVIGGLAILKGQNIYDVLSNKQDAVSKCVYHSRNDAIDNQIVNMEFSDGSNANLTMTAFSKDCYRVTHVHGTLGDVYGNSEDGLLHVNIYGEKEKIVDVNKEPLFNTDGVYLGGGHGGGDYYLYKDFIDYISGGEKSVTRTTIDQSIESHVLGFKAEESRINDGKVIKL